MEQTSNRAFCENKVHIYGYLNSVSGPFDASKKNPEKKGFFLHIADTETYKDKDGNDVKIVNSHSVKIVTDEEKYINKLIELQKDCEDNRAMRNNTEIPDKEKKYKTHFAAVDGGITSSSPKKDDSNAEADAESVKYSPYFIITNTDNIRFDQRITEMDKKLPNFIEFSGNMTEPKYSKGNEFADFGVAVRRVSQDKNGKEYEETHFINVQVSNKYRPKTFEAIKEGKLGKGDFIKVSGILKEEQFTNEDNVRVNVTRVDAEKVMVKIKKGQKKAEAEEVKEAPAETAKATNAKKVDHKKGRTL